MVQELAGSNGSSHAIGQGNNCTRQFLVPWDSRFTDAETLLGSSHPELPWSWCHHVRIEPFPPEPKASGGDISPTTEAIQYDQGLLTAEYATDFSVANQWPTVVPKPSLRANTTLQIAAQMAGEFMRFAARAARWADNLSADPDEPVPEDDSPAGRLLVRQGELTLTWNYVDNPPLDRFDAMMGCVNTAVFLGLGVETLLFSGYELAESTKASVTSPGTWTMKIQLQFRQIRIGAVSFGWNHEYRGEDGWERVYVHNGLDWALRYTPVDFSGMFT